MNRRDFMLQLSASITAPALATPASAEPAPQVQPTALPISAANRPNVLLMICDDLGFGDLGCYGSSMPTPHLDQLAAQGTRCVRYNSTHPICSASRAALLTGRYAPRSHTAGAYFPKSPTGTSLDETTLADLFRARGYRTHGIGKWHLGDAPQYLPTARGFDTYFGVPYSDDMTPLPLMRGIDTLEPDTDRAELTPRYTEEAVQLIQNSGADPFFLYLAYSYPHDPARGSKAFRGRSAFGDYGDAVEEIDWSVGRLLEAIEKAGKTKDTIILFTSDHGPWFQGSPGNTRGRKGTAFEGGMRVPLLVRWPGHIPSATVCSEWLSSLYILPTLAHWCGLDTPKLPLDGINIDLVLRERHPSPARPIIYFSYAGGPAVVHAIRSGPWKLRVAQNDGEIYTNDHTMGSHNYWLPRPELYHLEHDPLESYDVSKKNPETVTRLLAELDREMLTFPEDAQANFAKLKTNVASVVTPPGAAPRILKPEQLNQNWSYEPEDRNPLNSKP